jgi:hypothetical protein
MRASVVALAVWAVGCGPVASSDPGVAAALQVAGAQFVPGAPPTAAVNAPAVRALQFSDSSVIAGAANRPLLGAVDATATAAALDLEGDRGYWIVPAGVPSADAPTLPTFDVRVAFAATLPTGTRTLAARAIDGSGHFGAPLTQPVAIDGVTVPTGALVIHLAWSGRADLDLHVVQPDGVEIWARHPSGYQAPAPPALPDPVAAALAAQLDADSNAGCSFDGRDQENVVFASAPPDGHYVVRVDATSLCGAPFADWHVAVLADGVTRFGADGEAVDADTEGSHAGGAGRTAVTFDLP